MSALLQVHDPFWSDRIYVYCYSFGWHRIATSQRINWIAYKIAIIVWDCRRKLPWIQLEIIQEDSIANKWISMYSLHKLRLCDWRHTESIFFRRGTLTFTVEKVDYGLVFGFIMNLFLQSDVFMRMIFFSSKVCSLFIRIPLTQYTHTFSLIHYCSRLRANWPITLLYIHSIIKFLVLAVRCPCDTTLCIPTCVIMDTHPEAARRRFVFAQEIQRASTAFNFKW